MISMNLPLYIQNPELRSFFKESEIRGIVRSCRGGCLLLQTDNSIATLQSKNQYRL